VLKVVVAIVSLVFVNVVPVELDLRVNKNVQVTHGVLVVT